MTETRAPSQRIADLVSVQNTLDLVVEIADLALDIAEQAQGPSSDTERLREMLTKIKGDKK